MKAPFAALLGAAVLLAGCAGSGPPQPPFTDAFSHLYNQPSTAVPADVPVAVTQPLGIIFTDNVETYFQWVQAANAYWGNIIPSSLTNTAELADNDPNYVSGRFLTMLKRHFPNSEVVHDFQEAVAKRRAAVCVLDIRPLVGVGSFSTTKVDATAYLFDAQMNPRSALSGHGEAPAGTA